MPIRLSKPSIREFVDGLAPGTRVIWIADGAAGTVQPDKTILWDNGHHMTRKEMRDHHALLIHSESERRQLIRALDSRLKCLKNGCTLVHWDDETYRSELPERLCPIAVLTVPSSPADARSHDTPPDRSQQPSAA
jgi:hypothetical protein